MKMTRVGQIHVAMNERSFHVTRGGAPRTMHYLPRRRGWVGSELAGAHSPVSISTRETRKPPLLLSALSQFNSGNWKLENTGALQRALIERG